MTSSERDAEWRKFSMLCNELRSVKNSKGVASAVEKLQSFLSDDRSRQLVHRWRSWGFLLNCLLHVLKEEMRVYLNVGGAGRKRKSSARPKMPQLRYWHYLRTELETAHVAADGPMLHLDPNGRDCICQLFTFSVAIIDRQTPIEFDRSFETLVDKEAWLTVEVLVQYRVYCAVLDYKDWKNMLQLALGSISPKFDANLIGDVDTAATRARVIRFLVRNCPFDLNGDVLAGLVEEIENWFEAGKGESMERDADSLLLVIASTLLETLTDLMRTYFGSMGPYLLKRGVTILEFIVKSNKARKNGLRGAPAEFLMLFFELYRHNEAPEPEFCYLPPAKLLREMKKVVQVAMGTDEINLLMTHFNSAREQRLGNALGIDDQGIRHLACTADIIFYHDCLVSDQMQTSGSFTQEEDLFDPVVVGSKRPRSISTVLAWETVIEQFYDSPRTDTQLMTASSASPASQRHSSTVSYLSRGSSQTQRTEAKQINDSGSWLLLLLSILSRHGDYYVRNRIGDLMMVMQKLSDMLIVKEMGKWQALTLQILIQLAALSARHREGCDGNLNEHWASVWRNLLRPELPYTRVTEGIGLMRGQAGDAVLTLINCCISFGLVSENIIEASSTVLWNLPAFRQPSADTPVSRGDRMRPYARTSMASVCTLLSLLRHVQVPAGANSPATSSQGPELLSAGEEIFRSEHESVQTRLLRSVFDHLRAQVFRGNTTMAGKSTNSLTKVDWQTEMSSLVYAWVIQSFFGHKNSSMDTRETIFTPELIRKLSARNVDECDSFVTGEELNGFGVAFCMLETGLDHLSMAFPQSTGVKPSAFSAATHAFVGENVESGDASWHDGVKSCATRTEDQFKRLAVPTGLMKKLILPQDSNRMLSRDCVCSTAYSQSISTERATALQTNVIDSFSDLLSEISSKLPSDGCNPIKGLRVLSNSLDVGLVLAALYAEGGSDSSMRKENRLRVLPMLKHFFEIVASYLKPSVIKQAQQSQSMSESVLHTLRKLHTVILVSQGRETLAKCHHPSADPIELRTPPDLRPSIRAIVSMLEESLASLSGGGDTPSNPPTPTLSRPRTGFSSLRTSRWESTANRQTTSQHPSQPTQRDWDVMDDGEEDDIARDRSPSRVLQKTIGLWSFRVILLLKKDSGLSSVKKHVQAIQFDPDFVLAVAVLLCGVTGSDSLEAFVTLIDYAADEGMRDNGTLSTTRGGSCRAAIFLSQVLSVLLLSGLVHETRKYQHDEQPPAALVECAKKHLKSMSDLTLRKSVRMARRSELQCLEVFFRLHSRKFSVFEDLCVDGLTDSDTSVRSIAARGLQTVYYMYPQGGKKICKHFVQVQESLLDAPANTNENVVAVDGEQIHARQGSLDPRLCIDKCLPVLLSLYVSACSSQTALPEVLNACVEMASTTVSLYGVGTPSLVSQWLKAIALFYGYASVSDLLDDHFCHLWHRFITSSHRRAPQNDEEDGTEWMKTDPLAPLPDGKSLLLQFPLSTLLGEELDVNAQRAQLVKKLDMIIPIGVLHSFISSDRSDVKGGHFGFVDELLSCFSADNERQSEHVISEVGAQLTTDLFAYSFILLAHPDPELKKLAQQMIDVAEERAQAGTLSLSHLGHIASKMARFTVWDIIQGNEEKLITQSELWKDALKAMKEKYSEFDWKLINMADLLSEFYVLLLRTELYDPSAECAVDCFKIFVVETREAVAESPLLQHLLLSICFQSIKHLAVRSRQRIGHVLSLLVRESCESCMKSADMFGKYLGFVVQEISGILSKCNAPTEHKTRLCLSADDQAELEWVIFAVCNDLGSGLGKYALDIDIVPDGISASLDKLNALIINSRKIVSTEASGKEGKTNVPRPLSGGRRNRAKQQIQMFIQREQVRGAKFYNPLPFNVISDKAIVKASTQTAASFVTDVRLSAVTSSIDTVRDSSQPARKLYGKLAHTLLYLSSSGTFGSEHCERGEGMASLADALGELGALDASEYELSPSEQDGDLSRLYRRHFRRGALREIKMTYSLVMHENVLVYLSSLFFEGARSGTVDPTVLEETLKTLKNVLSVDVGVAALARSKDGELKAFLEPFVSSSPSNWSSAAPHYGAGWEVKPKRTSRQFLELWTSAEELGFAAWVCSLTACLTRESCDPMLKACSALCAVRVDWAVFLFPYALDSILRIRDDGKNEDDETKEDSPGKEALCRISKIANQGVRFVLTGSTDKSGSSTREPSNPQPLEAVQLVVHGINFLRETDKARFVETNGRGQQKSGKTKVSKQQPSNDLAYGCLVDVDLLAVAKAAVRVKMPYSAMQYAEMWLEEKNGGKITSLSSLDNDEVGTTLREILVEAYSFDSDDDGIYGVNDGRTMKSQLVKYNREGEYAKALPLYDVSLQFSSQQTGDEVGNSNPPRLVEGILTSLHSLGYNHLLAGYLQSLQLNEHGVSPASASAQAVENKYKLAWKSLQWEVVLPSWSTSFSQQHTIYQSLRAIAHGDFTHLQRVTTDAKQQILQSVQLSLHSFESTKDSYSALVDLQAIHEIEELAKAVRALKATRASCIRATTSITGLRPYSSLDEALVVSRVEALTAMPLLERWRQRRGQIKNDFDKAESLLALEEILLQVSKPVDAAQVITKVYLNLASLSRKAGRTAVAYRALMKLEELETRGSLSIYETMQWRIQKAKFMWKQQESRSAIWTGKKISADLASHLHDSTLSATEVTSLLLLQVKVLTITGKWIACQRSESSQVILEDFFTKATDIISNMDAEAIAERSRDAAKAHFALAEFMAAMYQQVSARVTSREWLAGKRVVKARHDELQELQTMEQKMQNENRAHIHALNKEVVHDMNERAKVEASVDQFLIGALCSYGKGLTLSSQAELDMVFRVLSLWLNNQRKADINRVFIEDIIDMVPSYKLVPLSYQIISRISSSSDTGTFQTALRKLVMKLSVQHPHHTLVQLIALKNSGDVEGKGALQFRTNVGDNLAEGAKVYLTELRTTEQRELLESLDSMANAYVQLALFDTSAHHGQKKKIPLSKVNIFETNSGRSGGTPFDQCLRVRARRGESVAMPAVLTSTIAPQADLDYSNVARMHSFEPQFSITDSGIHRPKIIYCYGSDGKRYKQLVKGQDDTRQDLVIEQVFETMNQFLSEEKATRTRKLRLRTYRVVPLSPIAGVLEWVENTIPWGSYLVNRTSKRLSAHERYHPHELKHSECRHFLKNAPDKLAAYMEIQKNFTPVFHHFFLENFPDAAVWYRRRLAYVQSAAVTSIVGYILGIGDRHSQNILIHEETGELVHIDFGVVFDQGMALYTPETVPFRLTRDMVDGMGVSGVDGVFSRCCEVTLQLLRKKSASVVTILEVFVHDPLYRWTLSPLKALRIQGGEQGSKAMHSRSSSRNSSSNGTISTSDGQLEEDMHAEPGGTDAAARALIRVKQKLEGYEDPNGSALSIEGQVKQLMSVAQDPHNLCKLFPGWAPWL
ncbi:FATC domain-containing protein [Phytophthora infestans]|uniref:non-specific serine/threonine protein kinase n=1 Tax=Phytophthora infestans TaxID=4787 RepID=A0A8S9UYY4_PHYIN|nr:FATC domain-containing protein [Phytophthora infestans]